MSVPEGSGRVPPPDEALIVLRPKLAWRILPPLLLVLVVVDLRTEKDGDANLLAKRLFSFLFVLLGVVAAFRQRMELLVVGRGRASVGSVTAGTGTFTTGTVTGAVVGVVAVVATAP